MSMDEKTLAEWEALAAEATSGPWTSVRRPLKPGPTEYEQHQRWVVQSQHREVAVLDAGVTSAVLSIGADAALIAAARSAVPELVAEVRRLRAVVAELKAEFGTITRNASRAERERCAKVADDYAKRAWGAQNPCQPAAVAAEHVARDIRALPDE